MAVAHLEHVAYLDNAATTPMLPEAVAAMLPFLTDRYGNPSGSHGVARDARLALEQAREDMAVALGARPGQVVFTAGGSEADNLAILGAHAAMGGDVVCPAAEHDAVLRACAAAGGRAVPVSSDGTVELDALEAVLGPSTRVVSVMLTNNEVGSISPLEAVVDLVRERAPGAVVHTDAVQAFPWLDVAELAGDVDLIAVSAHKFGGPKGVGALVVRDRATVAPIVHGGGQERGRRSGTHNVAGIVAMAAAARATVASRRETVTRVAALRDRLADGLLAAVPGARETVPRSAKVAGNCHLLLPGVESEALLVLLDQAGVCASAGSACASGAIEPSHVLVAMGWSPEEARSSLRLSLGPTTTAADVDRALAAVPKAVADLRA